MEIKNMSFGKIYPMYLAKAERKGRTKDEVNTVICWLTGYNAMQIEELSVTETSFEEFFRSAPQLHPNRVFIKGSICGVKISEIEDMITKEVRYLDKLIDELAKGKSMDKILR